MKLPSLSYLAQHAGKAFLRFHFTIVSAVIGVSLAIFLVESSELTFNKFPYINAMLCAALGISLFFCADIFSDTRAFTSRQRLLTKLAALLVLLVIYFTLPDSESTRNTTLPYIRFAIYAITTHLLVAVIAFIRPGRVNGFWHYNRILFIRILASALYSGALYAGLALALGSLEFLFDVDLHEELFADLFILIGGVFNTWFFLAGIPKSFDDLDEIHEYPNALKVFSQYVLLPLLILYLLILYVYAGKIVISGNWPKGLVSYLIAAVGVLGILTLLLVYPYGNLSGNAWIKKFSRTYYFILFPLIALLFVAIGMRVADYGITINRYVIITLGVWLTVVCVYFAVGRTNIKFIPISLAITVLFVSFGPWGMFSVSERSQVNRLQAILEHGNILQSGKIQNEVIWLRDSLPDLFPVTKTNTNENLLSDSLHNEVYSILDYLDDHHGFNKIQPWFSQDLDSLISVPSKRKPSWNQPNEARSYMTSMGLNYERRFGKEGKYYTYASTSEETRFDAIDIRGYSFITDIEVRNYQDADGSSETFKTGDRSWRVYYGRTLAGDLSILSQQDTLVFQMDSLIQNLSLRYGETGNYNVQRSELTVTSRTKNVSGKLEVTTIQFGTESDTLMVQNLEGRLLLKLRE